MTPVHNHCLKKPDLLYKFCSIPPFLPIPSLLPPLPPFLSPSLPFSLLRRRSSPDCFDLIQSQNLLPSPIIFHQRFNLGSDITNYFSFFLLLNISILDYFFSRKKKRRWRIIRETHYTFPPWITSLSCANRLRNPLIFTRTFSASSPFEGPVPSILMELGNYLINYSKLYVKKKSLLFYSIWSWFW